MKPKLILLYFENRLLIFNSGRLLQHRLNLKPVVFSKKYILKVGMKSILKFKKAYELLSYELNKKVYTSELDGFLIFEIC